MRLHRVISTLLVGLFSLWLTSALEDSTRILTFEEMSKIKGGWLHNWKCERVPISASCLDYECDPDPWGSGYWRTDHSLGCLECCPDHIGYECDSGPACDEDYCMGCYYDLYRDSDCTILLTSYNLYNGGCSHCYERILVMKESLNKTPSLG